MEFDQCLNFLLTRAQQSVYQHFKNKLAAFDVTPVQYGVLNCLWREDGLTPKQIAETLSLDSSTITGILDRLENKGLLKRTSDPNDRRALRVVLTERGVKLREPVEKAAVEANQHYLEAFDGSDYERIKQYLKKIADR